MFPRITAGQRLPAVRLAELVAGEVRTLPLDSLLAGRRAVIVGIPGAFTPVCSGRHLPDFIANAERLKASGFDMIICITPNDPWVLRAWAREIDPEGKIRFLSDGNLELTRRAGLVSRETELNLGERSLRYVMVLQDAVIERMNVESSVLSVSCTRAQDVLLAA